MRIIQAAPGPDAAGGRTLIVGGSSGQASLALRPRRLSDRFLACLFGQSLDRRLAAGRAPEESVRLATRARRVVELSRRAELARNWEHVLTAAGRPAPALGRAAPLPRRRILSAEPLIRELSSRLRTAAPVSARGAATARLLLTDANSPLYNRTAPDESLAVLLREAIERLDPAQPLLAESPGPAGQPR